VIKQSLNFQASFPDFFDFVNFFDSSYFVNENFFAASGPIRAMGNWTDGLYISSGTTVEKFTKEVGVSAVGTATGIVYDMKQYGSLLYLGEAAGVIQVWNGTSLSLSCDIGAGNVMALETYGDNFYALETTTGRINSYDGTTWSLSCDSTLTSATGMISFGGYLWVYGSNGTNIQVLRYDGSSWVIIDSAVVADTVVFWDGFCIHNGALYLAHDDKIYKWDAPGSSAFSLAADIGGAVIISLFSWQGELLVANNSDEIMIVNEVAGSAAVIASLTWTPQGRAKHYEGQVFIGDDVSSAILLKPVQETYIKIHNATTTNPL
jgi:hypothetical protein